MARTLGHGDLAFLGGDSGGWKAGCQVVAQQLFQRFDARGAWYHGMAMGWPSLLKGLLNIPKTKSWKFRKCWVFKRKIRNSREILSGSMLVFGGHLPPEQVELLKMYQKGL